MSKRLAKKHWLEIKVSELLAFSQLVGDCLENQLSLLAKVQDRLTGTEKRLDHNTQVTNAEFERAFQRIEVLEAKVKSLEHQAKQKKPWFSRK